MADSRVDLVKSPIGICVKSGAPKPDISSADQSSAPAGGESVAYSDSASGVYVSTEIVRETRYRRRDERQGQEIPATPVGEIVARGDAEIGFQQISEMLPVPGVDIVGPLPADLQKITVFSAGIASGLERARGRQGTESNFWPRPRPRALVRSFVITTSTTN